MNNGSRLWIISEEMSISMLTKPSTQMPGGSAAQRLPPELVMARAMAETRGDRQAAMDSHGESDPPAGRPSLAGSSGWRHSQSGSSPSTPNSTGVFT